MLVSLMYATTVTIWRRGKGAVRGVRIPAESFIQAESVGIAADGNVIVELAIPDLSAHTTHHNGNINIHSANLPPNLAHYSEFDLQAAITKPR